MSAEFVPERGDIVWLEFSPQGGHEQSGRRPALVLSPKAYNERAGLALVCPITSQIKGYPFEVVLPNDSAARGAVLSDHVKSMDWRTRKARRFAKASEIILNEVTARLLTLLDPEESE